MKTVHVMMLLTCSWFFCVMWHFQWYGHVQQQSYLLRSMELSRRSLLAQERGRKICGRYVFA